MTRRLMVVIAASVLMLGVMSLSAHDNFRVIGSVTRLQERSIDVKNKDLKTTTIRIDKQTEVTRDKKAVGVAELKVGQSVVVEAYGDSEADLLALEIRIVPPIRGTR